jgi:hypothetical protein
MTLAQRLALQLQFSRNFSELLLADFKTPEQWTHQACPGSNHALWFVGHSANSDNAFLGMLAPDKKVEGPPFVAKFRAGTQPTNNPKDYPPAEEVLAYWRERRNTLLSIVEKLTDADLEKPLPAGSPLAARLPDVGGLVAFIGFHEGMHAGQVTTARRSLGFKPVVAVPPPKPAS